MRIADTHVPDPLTLRKIELQDEQVLSEAELRQRGFTHTGLYLKLVASYPIYQGHGHEYIMERLSDERLQVVTRYWATPRGTERYK